MFVMCACVWTQLSDLSDSLSKEKFQRILLKYYLNTCVGVVDNSEINSGN